LLKTNEKKTGSPLVLCPSWSIAQGHWSHYKLISTWNISTLKSSIKVKNRYTTKSINNDKTTFISNGTQSIALTTSCITNSRANKNLPSNSAAIWWAFWLILNKNIDHSIRGWVMRSHLYSNLFLLQGFLRWT